MVIQCPECQARFKMADEKAKHGVKVRCSRCQHVFPVLLPPAAVEPVAAPAASPAEPEAPAEASYTSPTEPSTRETAADQPSQDEFDGFSFSGSAKAAGASPASPAIDGFDLADFSIDTDTTTTGAAAGGNGIDELDLGDFNLDGGTPLATEGVRADNFNLDDERPTSELAFGSGEDKEAFGFSEQPATTDFSFDSAVANDDFSFDEEPQDFAGTEFGGFGSDATADDSALPSSAADEFSFGDLSPESAFAIDPPQAAADASADSAWSAGDGPNDEFEFSAPAPAATEEFDFSNLTFGDEPPAAHPAPPLSPAVSEVLPPLSAAPAPLSIKEPAAPPAMPSPPEDEEILFVPPPPEKKRAFSPAILLVLLLLVAGAGGYFFWQGGMPDLSSLVSGQTAPAAPAGQIRLADLNGYFINNAEAGQLFVIHGRVVNEFSEARSAIAIKGVLYNQAGQALMQQTVFSGNKLDENSLRTLPFAKIEENMNNQFGDSLSNLNVAPGKSLPFTIVFRNLPAGLAEYTAEVTDSKPGAS